MNSNEVLRRKHQSQQRSQKSENIEKLNIFVGSTDQKSLPRKTKILNKSVTNFEVKMQMAKGCEK